MPRAAPLGPLAWVWNPRGNGELAAGATVEGLLREAERSPPELESSVAYQLVAKYLQRRVPELSAAGVSFQFKICYVKCGPGALTPGEDALISKTHVGGEVFA